MKKLNDKVPSGGVFCNTCDKCLSKPRRRKNFTPTSYVKCYDCNWADKLKKVDTLTKPTNEALQTQIDVLFDILKEIQDKLAKF